MGINEQYLKGKENILNDESICIENRELFKVFFEKEEYKLKRNNNLRELDNPCYKTLNGYVLKFKNVNKWFNNKPWKELLKEDIQKFYDDFEDGKILNNKGLPFKDRKSYYSKVLRSKPFALAGKKDLVFEVMDFYVPNYHSEVRYIEEKTFRAIINVAIKVKHKLFLWLCWDIGENATSILNLEKRDITKRRNESTNEFEYIINLRKEILKRSRTSRSEITNYKETVELLDLLLKDLKNDNDKLFDFGQRQGEKVLARTVNITGAKCLPAGQKVTLKDLRSSMACDLLNKGWGTDEINARLGHKPSSTEIDKYVTFFALDKRKAKEKFHDNHLIRIRIELDEAKNREKLNSLRMEKMNNEIDELKRDIEIIMMLNNKIERGLVGLNETL